MSGISPIASYEIPQGITPNVASWRIDPKRAVMLVHDMQEYFLRPFTHSVAPASALIPNASRIKARCEALNIQVAYTAQPGSMTATQRGLLNDIWGPGMKASEEDRQVIEPVAPRDQDWMLTKWRYSAFMKTDLLERMEKGGYNQLIICGVYAHVGILSTAIESYSRDIETFIVSDATADFTQDDHRMALDYAAKNCAVIISTDDVMKQLEDA